MAASVAASYRAATGLRHEFVTTQHHHSMAGRDLVTKERCDTDRRGAYVVVTERGRKEIEAAAPGHVAAVRRLFLDHVSGAQLDTVAEVAEAVLAALDHEERGDADAMRNGARR